MISSHATPTPTGGGRPSLDEGHLERRAQAALFALDGVRVLFGHHSVGRNILEGVAQLESKVGARLDVIDVAIGENGKPLEKIADFVEQAIAGATDIVAMKLCYADFTPSTDVDVVLTAYRRAVAEIRRMRPDVVILHITPPLVAREADIKSTVRRALGLPVWSDASNAKRAELARRMLHAFPDEPLFDLARIESTTPNGGRSIDIVDGSPAPALWDGYTDDGGHLNERGRLLAAVAFVEALAAARRPERPEST